MPLGRGAALSAFEAVPNPVHEFGHGRNGARNDVIVAFRKRFGTRAGGSRFRRPSPAVTPSTTAIFLRMESTAVKRASGKRIASGTDGKPPPQPTSRMRAPASNAQTFGNSQRVEHVTQVQLVEILARDDVDLRVPVGVKVVQRRKPLPLAVGEFGEIFENQFQILTFNP